MASFPQLFAGTVALVPLLRSSRYPVGTIQFDDFTEQRFKRCAPLTGFTLQMEKISDSERATIEQFFTDAKGGFDHTWDLDVGGLTYQNMMFVSDRLAWGQEPDYPESWSASIEVRQVRKN